jgi:hypothetical protein
MYNNSNLFRFSTMLLTLLALTLPALAQKTSKEAKPARLIDQARLEILEVKKEDAQAKANPDGKIRNVPVRVRCKITIPDTAKLTSVRAELRTKNTDGSTTLVNQLVTIDELGVGLNLLIPNGVFARAFDLVLIAEIILLNDAGEEKKSALRAARSGVFPLPPGVPESRK